MYESFYKFSGKPFQLIPDPSFFFASRGHGRAFAYLKYGIYQGDGFIVITGEIGAGKTTLLRALMDEVDTERIVLGQLVSTQLDADDLLKAVASAFGLPIADATKADTLAALEAFLRSLPGQGRRALLIVDEAQNLSQRAMEELRMLSNFQIGARPLLQSFLVGQPELRDIMRGPSLQQLRQRVIASYHLGPLAREEVRGYVRHRLERVGWEGDPEVKESIFDLVYQETGGVPRAINVLFNRLLFGAYLRERHSIAPDDVGETIRELHDEIGPFNGAVVAEPSPVHAAKPGVGVGRLPNPAALTDRLDKLDRDVATAHDLLSSVLNSEGTAAREQPVLRRSRFGARTGR
jgi:putative secretion ATPase (PEP-CTERM system associated)